MASDDKLPIGVINPFSDAFLKTWNLWKDFRMEEHKFKYKGCISEQMALMQLTKLADGNEDAAIAIVHQSIGNSWSGFYKLKTVKIKAKNGAEQPATASNPETRKSFNDFYAGSNRKW